MPATPDPTKDPEFQRVLGNLIKAPPKSHAEMKLKPAKKQEKPKKDKPAD